MDAATIYCLLREQSESKVHDLSVNLFSYPHQWFCDLDQDRTLPKRTREGLGHPREARNRAASTSHWEVSAELAQIFVLDAPWMLPKEGVSSTSHWQEAKGTSQGILEGLCLQSGRVTPQSSPRGTGAGVWEEGVYILFIFLFFTV